MARTKPGRKKSPRPLGHAGFMLYQDQLEYMERHISNNSMWVRAIIDNAIKARSQK